MRAAVRHHVLCLGVSRRGEKSFIGCAGTRAAPRVLLGLRDLGPENGVVLPHGLLGWGEGDRDDAYTSIW